MVNHQIKDQPVVILIRGLPGSGKTYLARALQEAIGGDRVVMLDPDAIDFQSQEYLEHVKKLTAEGVDPQLHAYRFSRAKAYKGIEDNKIIIWNQPFTNLEICNKMAGRLRHHAQEHKLDLSILVVEVMLDPAVAKQRMVERKQAGGHGPSEETFTRFINDYQSFAGEGYKTVTVRGDADLEASVAAVMAALKHL